MTAPVLELQELSISFRRRGSWLRAVRDLSLSIGEGEAFGLVGESGSGKSTAALAALRYLPRNGRITGGRILFEGGDLAGFSEGELRRLRGNRIAAVYQNPSAALNPVLTIGRQVSEVFTQHRGQGEKAALDAARGMLHRVRITDPTRVLDAYPHQISGGMQQRVVIAMALATDPALLVLDEPTTALDATVQSEVLDLFAHLRREFSTALLFISHNLAVVRRVTDRVGVLYAGELVEDGPAETLFASPAHPYTRALVGCVPKLGQDKRTSRLISIEGAAPDLDSLPPGCPFTPRCPIARSSCADIHPVLEPKGAERTVRCPFTDDARGMAATQPVPVPPPDQGAPLLDCSEVVRSFGAATILRGIDLAVHRGETVGLVGESGSGKSTFAKVVAGLIPPTAGAIELDGKALAAWATQRSQPVRRAVQMVFQSPDTTLNPRHSIGGILGRAAGLLGGLGRRQRAARTTELLGAVRLPPTAAGAAPTQLSGGQRQRVAIARAFAGNPDLVILDEPTSALDVSVQAAVLDLLLDLQREHRVAYLFISHDLAVVRYLADRIAVLYRGELVEIGPADRVFSGPSHPYTRALLAAMPDAEVEQRPTEEREIDPDQGCPYRVRCPLAVERCSDEMPDWKDAGPAHQLRCWRELDVL